MTNGYLETISLIERLHRHFLEVVKLELDGLGIHDINNVQGMMLFNIGDAEMTVGELTLRGCYLGSNGSFNAQKNGEKAYLVRDRLIVMHRRHAEMLGQTAITGTDLQGVALTLSRLERFWIGASDISQPP